MLRTVASCLDDSPWSISLMSASAPVALGSVLVLTLPAAPSPDLIPFRSATKAFQFVEQRQVEVVHRGEVAAADSFRRFLEALERSLALDLAEVLFAQGLPKQEEGTTVAG